MKKLLSILLLLISVDALAQKNIDGMIRAEKSFAAWSVSNGTRNAFLKYLDSSGIIFDKGRPVNGISTWTLRPNRPGILNWEPEFAEIAGSQDFGYTTGPWTFQPGPGDTVSARGRFITVWHLDKTGEWKFLIDLGVSNVPKGSAGLKKINTAKLPGNTSASADMLKAEQDFIDSREKDQTAAYKSWLSDQSIINRNNVRPASNAKERALVVKATPESIRYQVTGSGISGSGDLGYVYGTTSLDGKTDGYLRIWRKEKKGWKIALEVLQF